MMRNISDNGINLIVSFEKEVLHVYDDGFGYPTAGVGHLLTAEEKLAMPIGTKISKQMSRDWFRDDLVKYTTAVNNACPGMTQNQFDAASSLCFNIGTAGFKKSSVAKFFNAGKIIESADAFLRWNKVKGVVVKGLTRRRNAERKLFLTPDSAASGTTATPAQPKPAVDPPPPPPPPSNTMQAPAPDGTVKKTVWGIIAAWFITAWGTIFDTVNDLIAKGFFTAQDAGTWALGVLRQLPVEIASTVRNNQKLVLISIAAIVGVLIYRNLKKQITFWIQIWTHARPDLTSINVAPSAVKDHPWWVFWK